MIIRKLQIWYRFLRWYAHIVRIKLPSLQVFSILSLKLHTGKYIASTSTTPLENFIVAGSFLPPKPSKQIINSFPLLVTRSDRWIEFDFYQVLSKTRFCSQDPSVESLLIFSQTFFSNWSPNDRTDYLRHCKGSDAFTMVWHGDVLQSRSEEIEFWRKKVDIFVHFNPKIKYQQEHPNDAEVLIWPGLPFPEEYFHEIAKTIKEKIPKLLFLGSKHRNRDVYSDFATNRIPCKILSHGRGHGNATAISYSDYIRSIAQHELIFANGYVNQKESIVVGRVLESILVGTTVLYESGSWLDDFFVPYEHYIPVRNRSDLVYKARYLLDNPGYSIRIARNAQEHLLANYSSNKFWGEVKHLLEKRRIK